MQHQNASTSKSTPKRKRKFKEDSSHPKITQYLSPKNDNRPPKQDPKFQPLDVKKHKKSRKIRDISLIPSYEKILADQKLFAEHKAKVQKLDVFDENLLNKFWLEYRLPEGECSEKLLDCRAMSNAELEAAFEKHVETLKGITKGTVFSERHDCYHKRQKEQIIDLRVSSNTVIFTQEQNEFLLDLMTKRLDPEDKRVVYSFQVLWPELCLRIFMDRHDMGADEATVYLKKRPVDV